MFNTFILKLGLTISGLLISIASLFGPTIAIQNSNIKLSGFQPGQAQKFTLAGSGITSAATTIQLASMKFPDASTKITMATLGSNIGYGTLEPGTSKEEQISFTGITQNADGTATLTGVSRGLSFYAPFNASTTLSLSHAGAGVFVLSNTAAFYSQFAIKQNNESITGIYTFSSTSAPVYDFNPTFAGASSTTIPSKGYVDGVAVAGCSNADEFTKGCVELATGVEAASSTSLGSTGARLVLSSIYATSSPGLNATATVVMSQIDGKLAQGFLRLSDAFNFTSTLAVGSSTPVVGNRFAVHGNTWITGTSTMANLAVASSTISINTVAYKYPNSDGASSTILMTNGGGGLTWNVIPSPTTFFTATSTAKGSTGGLVVAHGLGRIPNYVRVDLQAVVENNAATASIWCTSVGMATSTASQSVNFISQANTPNNVTTQPRTTIGRIAECDSETGGSVKIQFQLTGLDSTNITFALGTNANTANDSNVRNLTITAY